MKRVKFGFTQGLNVARLGLDENQIMTGCQMADRLDYDSVWAMDHSNVPQWKKAVVNDAWLMLAAIGAITKNVDDQFIGIIDDLVVMSEQDSELAEGLRWIDTQSRKQGVTFYEMAMIILRKHMAEKKAKEWLNNKLSPQ